MYVGFWKSGPRGRIGFRKDGDFKMSKARHAVALMQSSSLSKREAYRSQKDFMHLRSIPWSFYDAGREFIQSFNTSRGESVGRLVQRIYTNEVYFVYIYSFFFLLHCMYIPFESPSICSSEDSFNADKSNRDSLKRRRYS